MRDDLKKPAEEARSCSCDDPHHHHNQQQIIMGAAAGSSSTAHHHDDDDYINNPLVLETIPSSNIIESNPSAEAEAATATGTGTGTDEQTGTAEDFFANIFNVLSNIELHTTLPEQAFIISSSSHHEYDNPNPQNIVEKGESSGQKAKSNVPEITQSDGEDSRRDSKKSIRDQQPRRARSTQLHNMSERIRRDRIRKKMKTLQDLIPHCNTRDKASMLDDAIRYIKALQNQLEIMSSGPSSMIQSPYMLPAGYQMMQLPQFPPFMPLNSGIGMGMGMFGMPPSTTLPMMPFALPGHCQSTLAASGMTVVGTMPQMQLPLNPFQSVSSADSTLMARNFSPTIVCTTPGGTSSQNVPITDFSQVPQGNVLGNSSAMVLPSQIITPASSSSTGVASEVPEILEDDDDVDDDDDSGSSQRT